MGEAAQSPGTPAAHSGRLRRAAVLLAGASLFVGLLQAQQPPAASAASADDGSGSRTAEVALDGITPLIPAKDHTITLSGSVTNDSKSTITDARVGVRIAPGGPLTSRSAMAAVAARSGYGSADGFQTAGSSAALPDIPPKASRPFTLQIPVNALNLGPDGVYQLGVTLNGQTGSEAYEHVLGIQRTFLPWHEKPAAKETQFTFLWPLIDRPHLAVRSQSDQQQSPIFLDDGLAAELAPGGRLQQMVELGKSLPITWVVDPDLLATVDFMTRSYRVAGPGRDLDHTTVGTGTDDAKRWLNQLKNATDGHEVVALPFGDTDIASVAHRGRDVPGTLGHLKPATDLAVNTIDTILGVKAASNVAWPADGAVDPAIIDVATSGGADTVIARSDSFGETGALDYTPNSARPIAGGTTAVVADATLSKAFQGDMTRASNATLAVQEFLSQSLMINLQVPDKQRSIVVAPQRTPSASQAQEMARAIAAVDGSNWAGTISFDAATKAAPDPGASRKVPDSGSYPEYLRKQELDTAAFGQIQQTQNQLNGFVVILSRKDRVTVPFTAAILRSMSNAWRGDTDGSAAFRDSVDAYLTNLMGAVHILTKTTLTLSGRSATIPVTVKNDLGQAVTGLELRLTSAQENRLEIGDPQPVAIEGGHSRSLKFDTTASANGLTTVTAQLYTTDGVKYGEPMKFQVNVTKITDFVMLVIAGGLLLLVLAGVRMYRQRKRKAAAGDGNGEDNGRGGGPGQPEDPAPDGSPEALEDIDPARTGEKVEQ